LATIPPSRCALPATPPVCSRPCCDSLRSDSQEGMLTEFVFRSDSYLSELEAEVVAVTPEGGIVLDRTIFYAASGGQPSDTGSLSGTAGTVQLLSSVHPDGDKMAI